MVDEEHANLKSKVFFVWGTFCFVCIAFVYFMIYETKGLSLEQVDELYGIVNRAWKSKAFRPAVRFGDMEGTEGGTKMSLSEVAQNQERKRSVQDDESVGGVVGTHEPKY
jgi:SP family sugar:H+ symporter-like MFS transporter